MANGKRQNSNGFTFAICQILIPAKPITIQKGESVTAPKPEAIELVSRCYICHLLFAICHLNCSSD
jgi:hypothetical protein